LEEREGKKEVFVDDNYEEYEEEMDAKDAKLSERYLPKYKKEDWEEITFPEDMTP